MQSTFLSAIKSIHTFKGHSSVKTWLFGIAKNEYYSYLRKNPRNLKLEDISFRLEKDEISKSNIDVLDKVFIKEHKKE